MNNRNGPEIEDAFDEHEIVQGAIITINKMLKWCLVALRDSQFFEALAQPLVLAYFGSDPSVQQQLIATLKRLEERADIRFFDVDNAKVPWLDIQQWISSFTPQTRDRNLPIMVYFSTTPIRGMDNYTGTYHSHNNSITIAVNNVANMLWRSIKVEIPRAFRPLNDLRNNIERPFLHEMTHAVLLTTDVSVALPGPWNHPPSRMVTCYGTTYCQHLARTMPDQCFSNADSIAIFVVLLYIKLRMPQWNLEGLSATQSLPPMSQEAQDEITEEVEEEVWRTYGDIPEP